MDQARNYLDCTGKLLEYYQSLGKNAIAQLDEHQLHFKSTLGDNNIATIVKHLAGNMKSRFTNFLEEDGEKVWRLRDQEFLDTLQTKSDVIAAWNEGWNIVLAALNQVDPNILDTQLVYIRNQGHTIIEAFNRQLAHYAYHTGQIIFIAKSIKGTLWESLSIPVGDSKKYNEKKFEQEKDRGFFADDLIK